MNFTFSLLIFLYETVVLILSKALLNLINPSIFPSSCVSNNNLGPSNNLKYSSQTSLFTLSYLSCFSTGKV